MSEQKIDQSKCLIVVRVRGTISATKEARETLELLRLTHTNHAVIIDSRPAYKGMLQRVNNYVTWGEPTKDTITAMLTKRGRLAGNKKINEEFVQKAGFKSIEDLSEAIVNCKAVYSKIEGVEPRFKLHPPSKGYKGLTKKAYRAGGEAGYRGEAINDLVNRMV